MDRYTFTNKGKPIVDFAHSFFLFNIYKNVACVQAYGLIEPVERVTEKPEKMNSKIKINMCIFKGDIFFTLQKRAFPESRAG